MCNKPVLKIKKVNKVYSDYQFLYLQLMIPLTNLTKTTFLDARTHARAYMMINDQEKAMNFNGIKER